MKFMYPAEKFSAARRNLMLPHSQGEARSICDAFSECGSGLLNLNSDDLDDNAKRWIEVLKGLMDTSGIEDPDRRGTLTIKAETMSDEQKYELSRVVDSLAHWFDARLDEYYQPVNA